MEKRRVSKLGTSAVELKKNRVTRIIFKARINCKDCYLMQYDSKAKQYQLVGGYIDETDKNALAAAIREIAEELPEADLEINNNYKLREVYRTEQFEKALSSTYCVYSAYEVTAFFAYDVDNTVLQKIDSKINLWIDFNEILHAKAHNGRKIFRMSQEMLDAMRTSERSFKLSKLSFTRLLSDRRIQIAGLVVAVTGLIFTSLSFFLK